MICHFSMSLPIDEVTKLSYLYTSDMINLQVLFLSKITSTISIMVTITASGLQDMVRFLSG